MNGFVTQIIGPVVDVEFPEGQIPTIYNDMDCTPRQFAHALRPAVGN